MIFYAALPAQLSGSLVSPQLAFHPGRCCVRADE